MVFQGMGYGCMYFFLAVLVFVCVDVMVMSSP